MRNFILLKKTICVIAFPLLAGTASAQSTSSETVTLSPFTVSSDRSGGYGESSAVTGLGVALPIKLLPQNISLFNQEILRDIAVTDLRELAKYDASTYVSGRTLGATNTYRIRGFNAAILREGMPAPAGSLMGNIERVEILKGPSAVLYGADSPGGYINYIPKRPAARLGGTFRAAVGSYDFYEGELGLDAPLNSAKTLLLRVDSVYRDSESFRYNEWFKRSLFSGRLVWRPVQRLTVELYADKQKTRDASANQSAVILDPTLPGPAGQGIWLYDSGFQRLPRRYNDNDPKGVDATEVISFGYDITYSFDRDVSIRHRGSRFTRDRQWTSILGNLVQADGTTSAARSIASQMADQETDTFKTEVLWLKRLGDSFSHGFLVGHQYNDIFNLTGTGQTTIATSQNVRQRPDFHFVIDPAVVINVNRTLAEAKYNEFFAVSHSRIASDKLHLVAGVRYVEKSAPGSKSTTVPQFGATYAMTPRWSFWSMHNKSFRVVTTTDRFGNKLPDEEGVTSEVGLKWSGREDRSSVTVSLFRAERQNIVRSIQFAELDGTLVRDSTSSGLERVEGVDVEAAFTFGKSLTLKIGALLANSEIVSNEQTPIFEGLPMSSFPEKQGSIVATYRFTQERLKGWFIGTGAYSRSETRLNDNAVRLFLRSHGHTVVNLFGGWRGQLAGRDQEFQLNLSNVGDARYIEEGGYLGAPPEVRFTYRLSF